MPYGLYTVWLVGFTLLMASGLIVIETYTGLGVGGSVLGFVPMILAAMLSGLRFARTHGRLPGNGESWRFGLVSGLIVVLVSAALLVPVYALDPEGMAALLEKYNTLVHIRAVAIALAILWVVFALLNRSMFRIGARNALKSGPTPGPTIGPTSGPRQPDPTHRPDTMPTYRVNAPRTPEPLHPPVAPGTRRPFVYFTLWFAFLAVVLPLTGEGLRRGGVIDLPILASFAAAGLLAVLMSGLRFHRRNARRPGGVESLGFGVVSAVIEIGLLTLAAYLTHRFVMDEAARASVLAEMHARGGTDMLPLGLALIAGVVALVNYVIFNLGAGLGRPAQTA